MVNNLRILLTFTLFIGLFPSSNQATFTFSSQSTPIANQPQQLLSPYWSQLIQQWDALIYKVSYVYGLDPDFIAAVVMVTSNGSNDYTDTRGAMGLMGILPATAVSHPPSSTEELLKPSYNLNLGVKQLTQYTQEAGGDVAAALAAYHSGWANAHDSLPRAYAATVLDAYGRAIIVRTGGTAENATRWTLALEITHGDIPPHPLLLLDQAPSEITLHNSHIIYDNVNSEETTYHIRAYAVPLETTTAVPYPPPPTEETPLAKGESRNPRVILACLPSLPFLRGRLSTRWFAPSSCPSKSR